MNERLEVLAASEAAATKRITFLRQIIDSKSTSIVKKLQAKVELSQLESRTSHSHTHGSHVDVSKPKLSTRSSVVNADSSGLVAKNKAKVEREIKRNEERTKRENEIRQIQRQLREAGEAESAERTRKKLEEQLKAAEAAMERLDLEEAEEEKLEVEESARVSEKDVDGDSLETSDPADADVSFDFDGDGLSDSDSNLLEETIVPVPELAAAAKRDEAPPQDAAESSHAEVESVEVEQKPTTEPRPALLRTSTFVLREQIAMLQQENADQKKASERAKGMLEEQEKENNEQIGQLENHVGKLLTEAQDREKLLSHWKVKSRSLSVKCLQLGEDADKRESALEQLEDWKMIHQERIVSAKTENMRRVTIEAPAASTATTDVVTTTTTPLRPSLKSSRSRRFSTRASIDPSFQRSLARAKSKGNINDQLREEAKIEMTALEEQLALMDSEKSDLMKELQLMKQILASTSKKEDGGNGGSSKKNRERLVYQLSCKKCNKHMNFVGTTHHDLKKTMDKHFGQVVKAATAKNKKSVSLTSSFSLGPLMSSFSEKDNDDGNNSKANNAKSKSNGHKSEAWSEEFSQHFAKHCKPKIGKAKEKDVIMFCRQNVKVEVLRRSDGAELYWEDNE